MGERVPGRFRAELGRDERRTLDELTQDRREIDLTLLRLCVLGTPVVTGETRARWTYSQGSPDRSVVGGRDPGGGVAIARGSRRVLRTELTDTAYVRLNAEWGSLLDGQEGPPTSDQAPRGITGPALEAVEAAFARP